jgi:hypothetical protein
MRSPDSLAPASYKYTRPDAVVRAVGATTLRSESSVSSQGPVAVMTARVGGGLREARDQRGPGAVGSPSRASSDTGTAVALARTVACLRRRDAAETAPRESRFLRQRRAEQLGQLETGAAWAHPDPGDIPRRKIEPSPWWPESHARILAAARADPWPSRLVDLETRACQLTGDEFYERIRSPGKGLHPSYWLAALAARTGKNCVPPSRTAHLTGTASGPSYAGWC